MNDQNAPAKIPRRRCEAKILPATAEATGGFCMPCSNGPGNTLRLFATEPEHAANFFAAKGLALGHDGRCVKGFVTEWSVDSAPVRGALRAAWAGGP